MQMNPKWILLPEKKSEKATFSTISSIQQSGKGKPVKSKKFSDEML